MNGKIRLFDSKEATLLADINAHARTVTCMDSTSLPESGPFYVSVDESVLVRDVFDDAVNQGIRRTQLDIW